MSQFMPDPAQGQRLKPVRVPERGTESLLSPEELELQRRLFSSVETLPDKFKSWSIEYPAVNGLPIPASQIQGFAQYTAIQSQVLASESTSSTSYTNLTTTGPEVTGLSDGEYLLIFGCVFDSSGGDGHMSPSINGSTPSDNDAAYQQPSSANRFNMVRAVTKSLANNNNNTITMQYKVTSGAQVFKNRWFIVLRTGR